MPDAQGKMTTADYGYVNSFLNSNAEIKALVQKAVKNQWTPERFQMELKDTKWFKSYSDEAKRLQVLEKQDPASYKVEFDNAKSAAKAMYDQMGMTPPSNFDNLVKHIMVYGMDEEAARRYLAARGGFSVGEDQTNTGFVSVTVDQLRAMAADYGVPTSEATLMAQVRAINSGTGTVQGYEDTYRELAKKQYGTIADQLDAGRTVRDLAQPYLDMASEELGLDPQQMMLTDTKWTAMFQGDKAMTYDEFRASVRQDPRYNWINGAKARQESAKMANELAQRLGAVG